MRRSNNSLSKMRELKARIDVRRGGIKLSFTCEETVSNPYYQARIHAAERDTAFESRASAGAMLGISSTRLYQIERGLQEPHRDELLVMADTYEAPELLSVYCAMMCPVGKRIQALREKGKGEERDG